MGQGNKDTDVECHLEGRRGRCLNVFLVISTIFLLMSVTAVTVGGAIILKEIRSQLKSHPHAFEFETSKLSGGNPYPVYKMQNFAYVEANSSLLKTSTMRWAPVLYDTGSSVGSNFFFNEDQSSLMPKQEGTYFIYVELNLTCTYICNAGLFSLHVGDKLTCEVDLPYVTDSKPVRKKCWTVSHIKKQRLVTQMTVQKEELQYWKLELGGSGLGMFLVD